MDQQKNQKKNADIYKVKPRNVPLYRGWLFHNEGSDIS